MEAREKGASLEEWLESRTRCTSPAALAHASVEVDRKEFQSYDGPRAPLSATTVGAAAHTALGFLAFGWEVRAPGRASHPVVPC